MGYGKKRTSGAVLSPNIFFIGEHQLNALNELGFDFNEKIMVPSKEYGSSLLRDSSDVDEKEKTLRNNIKDLISKLGTYETRNIVTLNKEVGQGLQLTDTHEEYFIRRRLMSALEQEVGFNEESVLNLFSCPNEDGADFDDSYNFILDHGILVVVKEGFSTILKKESKKRFIKSIVNLEKTDYIYSSPLCDLYIKMSSVR